MSDTTSKPPLISPCGNYNICQLITMLAMQYATTVLTNTLKVPSSTSLKIARQNWKIPYIRAVSSCLRILQMYHQYCRWSVESSICSFPSLPLVLWSLELYVAFSTFVTSCMVLILIRHYSSKNGCQRKIILHSFNKAFFEFRFLCRESIGPSIWIPFM